jgi:sugar phosphate isomerase/epimerase
MQLSFQLYSARNFKPWPEFLAALKSYGYSQVEGYGEVYQNPAEFAADLDNAGLKMPSGHFGIDMLEDDFDGALSIINTFGMTQVFAPYLMEEDRPTDADGWRKFGARLEAVGQKLKSHGIAFGWHNHDFEFKKLPTGEFPMDLILEGGPNLLWEADIAWIVVGGEDPFAWIEKYADRITAIHVKDRAPEGQNADQDGWCDVGEGTLDWAGLLNAVKSKTKTSVFAVEHDNPANGFAFAKNSIDNIKKF